MLYEILRLPLMLLFMAFYKRIYFSKIHNFPKKGATIIATNHSTACAEQMLLATFQRRGVHFWARASVFPKGAFWTWLFRQGHLIPIYRPQEGIKNMVKNKDTFALSEQLLLSGGVLYIAPEGNCVLEKRLREFKTGTARIALQTAAATGFQQDVFVLPTGVNYTHHTRFRSEVLISCGEPIAMQPYKELYEKNPQAAVQQLNEAMRIAIRKEMVYIEEKADEPLVENLFTIFRNNRAETSMFPIFSRSRSRLEMEQGIAEHINKMPANEKAVLTEKVEHYFNLLQQAGIEDQDPNAPEPSIPIGLMLFAPLAAFGHLAGFLPLQAARYLRRRWVHDLQFWAPVAVVAAALTWFIYGIIITAVLAFLVGWWSLLAIPAAVMGQFTAIYHSEYLKNWNTSRRYWHWRNSHSKAAKELITLRKDICESRWSLVVGR